MSIEIEIGIPDFDYQDSMVSFTMTVSTRLPLMPTLVCQRFQLLQLVEKVAKNVLLKRRLANVPLASSKNNECTIVPLH